MLVKARLDLGELEPVGCVVADQMKEGAIVHRGAIVTA
jgi:hypothetical protein